MTEEQQRQWEIDITEYGNNAYLMWEYESFGVVSTLHIGTTPDLFPHPRRKKSAALLFDIERAKSGDAVEWLNNTGQWEFVPQDNLVYLHRQEARMRMKYPPKISTEETKITEKNK